MSLYIVKHYNPEEKLNAIVHTQTETEQNS